MKRIAWLCILTALPWLASAADHLNLEEGLPTQIEDAYPIAYRGREFQASMQYDRTGDHKDRFTMEPRVEFGFAPNWQGKITVPFYVGSADRTDSGNVGLEAFYNFNTEGIFLPAFALSARADLPTGKDSAGMDTTLKALMTRSITKTGLDRVHLNVAWKHNAGARDEQRDDLYRVIVGYSRRIGADTVAIVDFIREQEIERKREANIVEVGLRRQITPLTVITTGVGAGIGDESPSFRAMLGFQKSF
jgi:hypothetical protein